MPGVGRTVPLMEGGMDISVMFDVVVVDDDEETLELLLGQLSRERDVNVVATAVSADEALGAVEEHDVDLVVLDNLLEGPTKGVEIVGAIKALRPRCRIVLFAAAPDAARGQPGVDAFVAKTEGELLMPTVRLLLGMGRLADEAPPVFAYDEEEISL